MRRAVQCLASVLQSPDLRFAFGWDAVFFFSFTARLPTIYSVASLSGCGTAVICWLLNALAERARTDRGRAVNTIHGEVNRVKCSRDLIMMRKKRGAFGASFEERLRPPVHAFIQDAFIQSAAGDWMKNVSGISMNSRMMEMTCLLSSAQRPICRLTAFSC